MSVTKQGEAEDLDPSVSPVQEAAGPPRFTVPQVPRKTTAARAGATVPHAGNATAESRARPAEDGRRGVKLARISKRPDLIFRGMSSGSGVLIVLLVIFVGVFLFALALPALLQNNANFLTSREWVVSGAELRFGILGLLWTTVLSSVVAMAIAVPIAVGVALFITQYLPKRIAGSFAFLVDLLAAVPSIIFGLWGIAVLAPLLAPARDWLSSNLGWFPLFAPGLQSTGTVFVAAVVLAIMILPIITAISRDVFDQTPRDHIEASLALGATRWEMIRTAVLPYGRSGVISASMLGLGRALGETIAVMIILAQPAEGSAFSPSIFAGGETFASKIANNAAEFDTPSKTGAYIASGLVLFVVTFAVNAVARLIAERGLAKA